MSLLKRIGGTTPNVAEGSPAPTRNGPPRVEMAKLGAPPREHEDNNFAEMRMRVQNRLISELDPKIDLSNATKVRQQVEDIFNSILDSENVVLSRSERAKMFESIAADIMGFRATRGAAQRYRDQRNHGQWPAPGLCRAPG